MKTQLDKKTTAYIILMMFSITCALAQTGANKSLSNLTAPTAVNVDLLPPTTNNINLGSKSLGWKNMYLKGKLYLDGIVFLDNSGTSNTWVGNTGNTTNTGGNNTAVGYQSLHSNTTGSHNTANGSAVLYSNTTGSDNTSNGFNALFSNTTGTNNTACGSFALLNNTTGFYNTASGYAALYSNTTGVENTANGFQALYYNTTGFNNTANGRNALASNTVGIANTANGYYALSSNTTGIANTATGNDALLYNTTGQYNTANGSEALFNNSTGYENVANGFVALHSNTTGFFNTADGGYALFNNTTGTANTANGYDALIYNTTGYNNTAYGVDALYSNATGMDNTALGFFADVSTGGLNDATAIGYNTVTNANDKIVIGTAANNNLTGGYGAWQSFSDGRFKENVRGNVPGLAFITKLHPVTYNLNAEKVDEFLGIKQRMDTCKNVGEKARYLQRLKEVSSQLQTGFIAQEVEATVKSIGYDFDGVHHPESDKDNYTIGYTTFVVPLVKAVQELDSMNKSKDEKIKDLKSEVENLKSSNEKIENEIQELKSVVLSSKSSDRTVEISADETSSQSLLGQNIPNPFDKSTLIPFRIPSNCNDASIVISEPATGKIARVIPVSCNETQLILDAGTLTSAAYSYSLYVNGSLISTKSMVLTK